MGSYSSERVGGGSQVSKMDTDITEQDWEQLNEKEREKN